MENNVVEAVALAGAAAHGLSPWALFWNADWVVKSVMILLLLASIWCWAIIFEKSVTLRRLNGRADRFEQAFWSGSAVDDLYDRIGGHPPDPMSAVFVAAMREWRRTAARHSGENAPPDTLGERIERVMQLTAGRELERIERYMTFLASTGSTAPFVGLFGTVWGIMNSFSCDRRDQEHQPRGGRPGHRRGAVRHRARSARGDPGGARLQQAVARPRPLRRPGQRLRRRVPGDPVAADRRPALTMAASLRERGGGGRFGRRQTRPMSEINVTPLVDVMLVLLVIFMITAPLLTAGVQVDLPKTSAAAVQGQDEPVSVSIDRRGRLFVQETEVNGLDALAPRLAAITENNHDVRVFVRGDQGIPYGQVMAVIGAVHAAGFTKVALLTQPLEGAGSDRPRQTGSRAQR